MVRILLQDKFFVFIIVADVLAREGQGHPLDLDE